MRKLITLVLVCAISTLSFAQKNEVKAVEKALKNSNFSDAKSALNAAEGLVGSMDNKTKAKYYFLKAKAFYAGGAGSESDINTAITALNDLTDLESSMGKLKYTEEANLMKDGMFKSFVEKANTALQNKDYNTAAQGFEKVYKMSPKDTVYLYYAASSAVNAKDFDNSLRYYEELNSLGFTGIKMNYTAINKETGQVEYFPEKVNRNFAVKTLKTHSEPKDEMSPSKRSEIVKNIALIHVSQGNDEKALAAMADARKENPEDLGLLLSEANVYLKLGNRDKFKTLMEEATKMDPNNAELQYNLGVLAADANDNEQAKAYYEKAISLDPTYIDAYNNLAVLVLSSESTLVEEMNSLGNSAADNRRYDELKEKRADIYRSAIPYLEKSLEMKQSNINAARTLMNIYSVIGETDKFKAMKARVEALESSAQGN